MEQRRSGIWWLVIFEYFKELQESFKFDNSLRQAAGFRRRPIPFCHCERIEAISLPGDCHVVPKDFGTLRSDHCF